MTDQLPVWLLDVDGVVNATRPGWHRAPSRSTVVDSFGQPWVLRWEPALIDRIRKAHGHLAEVVWCTTWCPDADRLERLWGLPELRRSWTDHLHGHAANEAKRQAARDVLASGRWLVWTDDTAFPSKGPFREEFEVEGRALLVKPDARRGLRDDDLDTIEEWLRGPLTDEQIISSPAGAA